MFVSYFFLIISLVLFDAVKGGRNIITNSWVMLMIGWAGVGAES